jgi:hypothetical protein
MNRTELTVHKMLSAIEAPLYDVGVLSERGMLPSIDGISADAVLAKLSLLKYRNARASHIYIRPSGEHLYTVLDDLNEASVGKLSADGFDACAVIETSSGNFQAWLKHSAELPKLVGSLAAQTYLDQIRRSTGGGGHRLLCRSFRQWHGRRPDRACPRGRLSLPRSQSFNTGCLHPENHGKGERLGKSQAVE